MTKSLVRLSLLGVLLVAIAAPMLMAQGPYPIPWPCTNGYPCPKTTTATPAPPANAAGLPTLMADGIPIPWPKPTTTTEPPANAAGLPTLMADGIPIPWPRPTTTTEPPASAGLV